MTLHLAYWNQAVSFLAAIVLVPLSVGRASDIVDFEADSGFEAGRSLGDFPNWTAEAARISPEQYHAGSQSLEVGAAAAPGIAVRTVKWAGGNVAFVEFYILPGAGQSESEPVATVEIDGARLCFLQRTEDGEPVGVIEGADGQSSAQIDNGFRYAVIADGAEEWLRVNLWLNYQTRRWDLFINGRLVAANLSLPADGASQPGRLAFSSKGGSGTSYVDDLVVTAVNPLFEDADFDDMPDAYESVHGLSPFVNDRDGDANGDGRSNITEFLAASLPVSSPTAAARNILFVDNLHGSDANTGSLPYAAAGSEGPKASIKAAMSQAPGGALIVVLKGKGIYSEGSRGTPGKPLTIKTLEPILIK